MSEDTVKMTSSQRLIKLYDLIGRMQLVLDFLCEKDAGTDRADTVCEAMHFIDSEAEISLCASMVEEEREEALCEEFFALERAAGRPI